VTRPDPRRAPKLPPLHEAWLPREHSLHRPRHGGRQLVALVCALVFFAPPGLATLFGARPAEIENHALAGFPSLGSGWGFFTGLSKWASDNLIFKPGAVQAADGVSRGVFGEPAPFNQGTPDRAGPLPGSTSDTSEPMPSGPDKLPDPNDPKVYRRVIEGKDGWLYYGQDLDAKCRPAVPFDDTVAKVKQFRQAVESSGRQLVFVIAPDKSTAVPRYLPDSFPDQDCWRASTDLFWQRFLGETGAVDLRPRLAAAEQAVHHPVYHALDTHWTDEGALALTRAAAEHVTPGVTRTWTTKQGDAWVDYGDLPRLLGHSGLKRGNFYDLDPDGQHNGVRPVDVMQYGRQVLHLTRDGGPGVVDGKVGFIGDSFGATIVGYFPAVFADVSMAHYQLLVQNQQPTIQMLVDSKVVVVEVVERVLANGNPTFLQPDVLAKITAELAAHPMR
jgi:hypothetical protein